MDTFALHEEWAKLLPADKREEYLSHMRLQRAAHAAQLEHARRAGNAAAFTGAELTRIFAAAAYAVDNAPQDAVQHWQRLAWAESMLDLDAEAAKTLAIVAHRCLPATAPA